MRLCPSTRRAQRQRPCKLRFACSGVWYTCNLFRVGLLYSGWLQFSQSAMYSFLIFFFLCCLCSLCVFLTLYFQYKWQSLWCVFEKKKCPKCTPATEYRLQNRSMPAGLLISLVCSCSCWRWHYLSGVVGPDVRAITCSVCVFRFVLMGRMVGLTWYGIPGLNLER
jgi:hypothetical protein